jgi:hypothetical protein
VCERREAIHLAAYGGHGLFIATPRNEGAASRTGMTHSISLRRLEELRQLQVPTKASAGSSIANPGISVAISNKTLPGSRN